jgi:very-short-patch-repair endonuclease
MHGLSSASKEQISRLVENLFDKTALRFLGNIPKLQQKRFTLIGFEPTTGLAHIFIQAMNNKWLNHVEDDVLKGLLSGALSYIDILKNKTSNNILEKVEALAREAQISKEKISETEINKIIEEELGKARSGLETIIASESTKGRNLGMAMDITRSAAAVGEKDPVVFFNVIRDQSTCESCVKVNLMEDGVTPRLFYMSELSAGYFKRGDKFPSLLGQHPHCFVNKNAHIYTEHDGYVRIDKIKIGDRVLTHTGKFKSVLDTLESWTKPYNGSMVKIYFDGTTKSNGPKYSHVDGQKLCVTPEHQFMTSRGWVEAKDLTAEDELMQLFTECSTCGTDMPVKWGYKKKNRKTKIGEHFCSKKCVADFQWKDPNHRENVSGKAQIQMTEWAKNNQEEMKERVLLCHKANQILIENGEFWAQKEENKEFLAQHRAKLNSLNPRTSKEEAVFIDKVRDFYPTLESQKLMHIFTVDGVIEELKVILEYDGGGHYLPIFTKKMTEEGFFNKQKGRDKYLNKCGYHVLRYGPEYKIEDVVLDIERVSKNSTNKYFYKPLKISKIKNGQASNQKLYDLTVEDDESFVVNGVISHNCRCCPSSMPPGYGFNGNGFITYIGNGYDALKQQRGED